MTANSSTARWAWQLITPSPQHISPARNYSKHCLEIVFRFFRVLNDRGKSEWSFHVTTMHKHTIFIQKTRTEGTRKAYRIRGLILYF
jgi:hypothetical protein